MTQSFNYKINAIDTDNANRKNMPKILYKVKLKRGEIHNEKLQSNTLCKMER